MKYFLIVIVGFVFVRATMFYLRFQNLKERLSYELEKIEVEININAKTPILLGKRGTLYLKEQNFLKANLDFREALKMNNNNLLDKDEELAAKLKVNIGYTEKPLPWSKGGPKDLSNSWITYWLIDGFGESRFNIKE